MKTEEDRWRRKRIGKAHLHVLRWVSSCSLFVLVPDNNQEEQPTGGLCYLWRSRPSTSSEMIRTPPARALPAPPTPSRLRRSSANSLLITTAVLQLELVILLQLLYVERVSSPLVMDLVEASGVPTETECPLPRQEGRIIWRKRSRRHACELLHHSAEIGSVRVEDRCWGPFRCPRSPPRCSPRAALAYRLNRRHGSRRRDHRRVCYVSCTAGHDAVVEISVVDLRRRPIGMAWVGVADGHGGGEENTTGRLKDLSVYLSSSSSPIKFLQAVVFSATCVEDCRCRLGTN